jgi:hypothetical protein
MDAGLPRMLEMVQTGTDEEVLKIMLPMIEYFKPKLARTETHNTNDNKLIINVNWEDAGNKLDTPKTALESGQSIEPLPEVQRPEMRPPVR